MKITKKTTRAPEKISFPKKTRAEYTELILDCFDASVLAMILTSALIGHAAGLAGTSNTCLYAIYQPLHDANLLLHDLFRRKEERM